MNYDKMSDKILKEFSDKILQEIADMVSKKITEQLLENNTLRNYISDYIKKS